MLGREHSGKVWKKFIGNFYFWGITLKDGILAFSLWSAQFCLALFLFSVMTVKVWIFQLSHCSVFEFFESIRLHFQRWRHLRTFAPIATAHLWCPRYTWRGTRRVMYFKRAHRVETQQNIELMSFAVTWSANIFVGCSAVHFLLWFFPLY